jgi:hypothetical protein
MKNNDKEFKKNVELWKRAYSEILNVCEKYSNFSNQFNFDDIDNMVGDAKNHLLLIEWYEKYGLKLDHSSNKPYTSNYLNVNSYCSFQLFKDAENCKREGYGRLISWSDDGRQPEDGWYFCIGFSTGAYIFGEDYESQKQLFQDFFQELKSYKPDYSDSTNHDLYWKIENCKKIYDSFDSIIEKYHEKNKSELNERRAKKLREELAKVEKELGK